MSLTGNAFPFALAVGAVLLLIALVVGFPAVRNRWLAGAARGVLALLMNAAVVTLAFVLLNDQYGFYPSWQDLVGYHSTALTVRHGSSSQHATEAKVRGVGFTQWHTPQTLPPLPSPGSRWQRYTVHGPTSNFRNEVDVYLPAGYNPASSRTYPVVLGLHGFPGDIASFSRFHVIASIDRMVAEHRMQAPIVVLPSINDPVDLDTECVNAANGPKAENWLAHDVPQWVVDHFRVRRDRTSWATWGLSFGGWCSALLGMRHPDVFGASVVMEGYFTPDFSSNYVPFRPGSKAYAAYDLVRLARSKHAPPLNLWLLTSKEDTLSYPSSAAMVRDARAPMSVTAVLLKHGGHVPGVWVPYEDRSFTWLANVLPGFDPLTAVYAHPYQSKVHTATSHR